MKFNPLFYSILLAVCLISNSVSVKAEDIASHNPLEGDMVLIPAGHFVFGTNKKDESAEALSLGIPKPWYADETPRQSIFLKKFYIDRYEVTNKRYKIFVDDLGVIPPEDWKGTDFPEGKGDYPVVNVNWFDATNFCQWAGKKLPTEKQWEKAARGPEGFEYPWGNSFEPGVANLSSRAGSKNAVTPVGSFPRGANALGVHDLVGNVWEWVNDDYSAYKGNTFNSEFYDLGYKVLRGQSAQDIGHFPGDTYQAALKMFARSGHRQFGDPDQGALDVGFRCISEEPHPAMKLTTAPLNPSPIGGGGPGLNFGGGNPSTSSSPPTDLAFLKSETSSTNQDVNFNPFEAKPNLPQSGILVLVFLSFVAGVFSFLSPCTLPILPAYFAVTAQTDRTRIGLMSLAFFFGLATLFTAMGASASLIGGILRDYLFSLTTIGGVLVIVFGIMTLFGKGFSGASFQGRPASTFLGFFLFGATFALGWTPCVGPILSGILILAASDKTILQGMSLLFFFAVGLGLPLILISTFCGRLPKDGLFWRILRGKGWDISLGNHTLFLHTTNLFSGLLLITLGIMLAMGYLTYINSLIPIEVQIWFSDFEESVLHWFM